MKLNNVGYNIALQMLNSKKVQYYKTSGGHYKIPVSDNDFDSIEDYEKLLRENEKLRTIIKNIFNIIKECEKNV